MTKVEVYRQKTQKHKNTWRMLVVCPQILRKNTKTRKIQRGFPLCCLGLTTRLPKDKPNKKLLSFARLHLGVKKYKNTQLLREKILVFMVKKNTKLHKTQKTHLVILCPITSHI